jgi:hypothetical protein
MADEQQQDQQDQRDADQQDQHNASDQSNDSDASLGDAGKTALKAERDARKKAERDALALQKRVKEFEDAQKTEAQKQAEALEAAEKRAATFEQRYREAQGRISLTQAANAITNVYDPDTVADLAMTHLTYDDDGKPTNVADAIEKVRELRPRLFPAATGSGDGGRGNGQDMKQDLNALVRSQLGG